MSKLPTLFLVSLLGLSITAMQQEIITSCKNIPHTELILGIKHLPQELKLRILYLMLQSTLVDFQLYKTLNLNNHSYSVTFSTDGERCLTGSADNSASLWDAETGELVTALTGHYGAIYSAAFSPQGERVITGSYDNSACIWNAKTGELLLTLKEYSTVCAVAFSADGETAFTGSWDTTICRWDTKTGKLLKDFKAPADSTMSSDSFIENHLVIAFSKDGETVITGMSDEAICVWNTNTGELLKTLKRKTKYPKAISSITFCPSEERCLIGFYNGTANLWDYKTGERLKFFKGHKTPPFTSGVSDPSRIASLACSPDGKTFLTGSWDMKACLWNCKTGELLTTLKGHTSYIDSVAFSPHGGTIITGSWDNTACLWRRVHNLTNLSRKKKEVAFNHFKLLLYTINTYSPEKVKAELL